MVVFAVEEKFIIDLLNSSSSPISANNFLSIFLSLKGFSIKSFTALFISFSTVGLNDGAAGFLFGSYLISGNNTFIRGFLIVGFILGEEPTEEQELTADMTQDGTLNILDVIQVVGEILGTNFRGAVEWLIENFPELEVERRLQELDKSIYFTK